MKKPQSKKRPWMPQRQGKTDARRRNQSFYHSQKWRRMRNSILSEQPLCRMCLHEGRYTEATIVDHIQPINEGGSKLERDNLQPLCEKHHNQKTAKEMKR